MKKGFIAFVIAMLITGCSCSKVDENTYNKAINDFNSSDAIAFTRIEKVTNKVDVSDYTKTTIEAKYIFSSNRRGEVEKMEYVINKSEKEFVSETIEYYYSNSDQTMYRRKLVRPNSETKLKQNLYFDNYFSVNNCSTTECLLAIPQNLAPIYEIENVNGFLIREERGEAIATFTAACPTSYETCNGKNTLDYTVIIGGDGQISGLSYQIEGETTITTVSYSFDGFGINNVQIVFQQALYSYEEGIID